MINIHEEVKAEFQKTVEYRRHLHQNPELSFKEFKTSDFIEKTLKSFEPSLEISRPTPTSVIAILKTEISGAALIIVGFSMLGTLANVDFTPEEFVPVGAIMMVTAFMFDYVGGIVIFTAIIEYRLKDLLIGENCFNREGIFEKLIGRGTSAYALGAKGAACSAVAGVDIALNDLCGKLLKTPVYNLLGGKINNKIPAYASGFFGIKGRALTPKECGEEAKKYADQGFQGIKMKIGFGLKKDMQNLTAVREALGPDLGIMVDANQGFDFPEIAKQLDKYAAFDVTFIEEPLRINDLTGMANLSARGLGIAAGENYYTKYEFREVLEKRAVNYIQPDIIHAGGITETKKIASMAAAYDIPLCPHIHASVGVSASIQLLASCSNTFAAEYITSGGSYQLRKELCGNSYMVKEGYLIVNDEFGLGIEVNEDIFEKYYPKWMK